MMIVLSSSVKQSTQDHMDILVPRSYEPCSASKFKFQPPFKFVGFATAIQPTENCKTNCTFGNSQERRYDKNGRGMRMVHDWKFGRSNFLGINDMEWCILTPTTERRESRLIPFLSSVCIFDQSQWTKTSSSTNISFRFDGDKSIATLRDASFQDSSKKVVTPVPGRTRTLGIKIERLTLLEDLIWGGSYLHLELQIKRVSSAFLHFNYSCQRRRAAFPISPSSHSS